MNKKIKKEIRDLLYNKIKYEFQKNYEKYFELDYSEGGRGETTTYISPRYTDEPFNNFVDGLMPKLITIIKELEVNHE